MLQTYRTLCYFKGIYPSFLRAFPTAIPKADADEQVEECFQPDQRLSIVQIQLIF